MEVAKLPIVSRSAEHPRCPPAPQQRPSIAASLAPPARGDRAKNKYNVKKKKRRRKNLHAAVDLLSGPLHAAQHAGKHTERTGGAGRVGPERAAAADLFPPQMIKRL